MKLLTNIFVFLALIGMSIPEVKAQDNKFKDKKYIFILDITKSMWGCCGAQDIFDDVRDHLIKAINNIPDPKVEIVIRTYQEEIIHKWEANATLEGKKYLISNLNKINDKNIPGQETNAYGALIEANRHVDKDKINIVFILTDGEHTDKSVDIQLLYDEIPKWEKTSNDQQAYMFIVELTNLAIDNKVRELVKETKDVQIIHGIEFFILEIIETNPILNIDDELSFKLDLAKDNWDSKYDNLPISLSLDNPYFSLEKMDLTFKDLPANIKLNPKKSLEEIKKKLDTISKVTIKIKYPAKKYPQIKILNNQIDIQLNNRKEKVLLIEVLD